MGTVTAELQRIEHQLFWIKDLKFIKSFKVEVHK